jgi:hypothetical protein
MGLADPWEPNGTCLGHDNGSMAMTMELLKHFRHFKCNISAIKPIYYSTYFFLKFFRYARAEHVAPLAQIGTIIASEIGFHLYYLSSY